MPCLHAEPGFVDTFIGRGGGSASCQYYIALVRAVLVHKASCSISRKSSLTPINNVVLVAVRIASGEERDDCSFPQNEITRSNMTSLPYHVYIGNFLA